jgi:hypothetical protein
LLLKTHYPVDPPLLVAVVVSTCVVEAADIEE